MSWHEESKLIRWFLLLDSWQKELVVVQPSRFFAPCGYSPQVLPLHVTVHVFLRALAAMIGKMADDQEFEEKTGSSDSEEEEDDEVDNVTNGRDDVDEDESEYDDPEGFVDDITDEGNFIVQLTG